jgi:DNA-binding NarL/FixJ family response regulator
MTDYRCARGSVMRIFLVNQDATTLSSLGILFRAQPDLELVGAAADVSQSLSDVSASDPDVVLIDFDPGAESLEQMLAAIKSLELPPAVVALSVRAEKCQDALDAGADAFACKGESPDRLLSSIRSVGRDRIKKPR